MGSADAPAKDGHRRTSIRTCGETPRGDAVPELSSSRHFDLRPLADGVWAAVHRIGGYAVGNAGIVDLGGATLLFDAGLTPEVGADLGDAALALTGRAPAYVALSHYHNDHIRGAQALPSVPSIASETTRALIATLGREELASDLEHGAAQLAATRDLEGHQDPVKSAFAAYFVPYWEGIVASAPHVTLRLPDLTFADRLQFHGTRRSVDLRSLGAGHTPDDAILVLPDDGIVFCSDLLFVGCHPYLADGEPEGWRRGLDALAGLAAERYVPGHGEIGGPDDVRGMAAHLDALQATAEDLHRGGFGPEEVGDLVPEDATAAWDFAYPFYQANLRFLLRRLRG
jgi:cyclase